MTKNQRILRRVSEYIIIFFAAAVVDDNDPEAQFKQAAAKLDELLLRLVGRDKCDHSVISGVSLHNDSPFTFCFPYYNYTDRTLTIP